jgi:hypothetical protein
LKRQTVPEFCVRGAPSESRCSKRVQDAAAPCTYEYQLLAPSGAPEKPHSHVHARTDMSTGGGTRKWSLDHSSQQPRPERTRIHVRDIRAERRLRREGHHHRDACSERSSSSSWVICMSMARGAYAPACLPACAWCLRGCGRGQPGLVPLCCGLVACAACYCPSRWPPSGFRVYCLLASLLALLLPLGSGRSYLAPCRA